MQHVFIAESFDYAGTLMFGHELRDHNVAADLPVSQEAWKT